MLECMRGELGGRVPTLHFEDAVNYLIEELAKIPGAGADERQTTAGAWLGCMD